MSFRPDLHAGNEAACLSCRLRDRCCWQVAVPVSFACRFLLLIRSSSPYALVESEVQVDAVHHEKGRSVASRYSFNAGCVKPLTLTNNPTAFLPLRFTFAADVQVSTVYGSSLPSCLDYVVVGVERQRAVDLFTV